jgi:osmotically-inducible protein OsmY
MQGGRGESGYGESGYGISGYGEGRVAWAEQRESYGRQREPRPGGSGQERQRGQFAGRGPKGYKRSDDRIREDVNEELTRNPDLDATDIEVKVESGEVTLSGTVDDRRAKRLAEELVERCSGVHEVHNQLRIDHAQSESGSEREGGETMPRRS